MSLLSLEALLARLETWDEDRLARLLRLRPDLLAPSPQDLTTLAVRVGSEASIRTHLQRLDAATLGAAVTLARAAAQAPDLAQADPGQEPDPAAVEALHAAGLFFSEIGSAQSLATPARLPHIIDSLTAHLPELAGTLAADSAPRPSPASASAAVIENASLAAITELLDDVAELLALLAASPATTLRTGGVGMRELRRIAAASARWGPPVSSSSARGRTSAGTLGALTGTDASVGEIGWLLELTAACGLIELADGQSWSPGRFAQQWGAAARQHQHQLLVSGWLLAPRAPMLLRGPHPSSRIAPTLGLDRQRGDAEQLRRALLETARGLIEEPSGPEGQLYALNLPEDDLPGPDALTGALPRRLAARRPLLSARVMHLLPWLMREAERLGLFAVGTLSTAGDALLEGSLPREAVRQDPAPSAGARWRPGLSRLAERLASTMPAQVDTILVQSDLTAIATGALSPDSAAALADFAQREGHGAVPTFRFSPESLHRGLTRGWTGAGMLTWLESHSLTEVPAALRTQVEDAARTWRGVQIGEAGAWLRVTDADQRAAMLAHPVLDGLGLQVLAEDILICRAPVKAMEQALTEAGFNTARHTEAEPESHRREPAGTSAEHTASWALETSPWEQSPVRITSAEPGEQDENLLRATAAALRQAGRAAPSSSSDSAATQDVIGTLRSALAGRRELTLIRVSPQGSTHRLTGVPTGMNAGRVRIRVRDDQGDATVMLHRIAAVEETTSQETPPQGGSMQASAEHPGNLEESNG
ncbi:helicase-associated domain-containing protein [Nesterenkonia aurantiaca]|uniref:XPB/Ssl2-like helicase family protein n=2 Tax=Nesterenkonia TaxID=57494 RepID=A0A4R7G2P5_9MICC|nr:helicase-associated domain-containing protein [Nesterenkonia aurantiaca]TDS85396.1 XPB/Ssl2-like helicase family protein [Nesterenkonia aurantiaca]